MIVLLLTSVVEAVLHARGLCVYAWVQRSLSVMCQEILLVIAAVKIRLPPLRWTVAYMFVQRCVPNNIRLQVVRL